MEVFNSLVLQLRGRWGWFVDWFRLSKLSVLSTVFSTLIETSHTPSTSTRWISRSGAMLS